MTDKINQIDFNQLDKLIRIDDPRMNDLSDDIKFNRSKIGYDKIKFLRNGTDAKFEIIYDEQRWVFRPLSGIEELDCELLANEKLYKLAEYQRTSVYREYYKILYTLAKAMTSCPEHNSTLDLEKLECIPRPYIIGLYVQYEKLIADINCDIDKFTQKELEELIEEFIKHPKSLSNCSYKQLHLVTLELLKTNILLRGN